MRIYKIFRAPEWVALESHGRTDGAPVDLADGFIHFSTAEQLSETLSKHFKGQENLVLAAAEAEALGAALKWEPSRGGALFPHLYRALERADIVWSAPLAHDAEGRPVLPDAL
jgi:uncharacterized protein (DUF952 family)